MKKIYLSLILWMLDASVYLRNQTTIYNRCDITLNTGNKTGYTCQNATMFCAGFCTWLANSLNRAETIKNQWFNSKIKFWKAL